MCVDRLEVGLKPACAAACLAGALDFGIMETKPDNRDQLETRIPGFPTPDITHPNIRFQQTRSLPRELQRPDSMPLRYEHSGKSGDAYTAQVDGLGTLRLLDAGHILGSSIVELWLEENGVRRKLVFSGDLGATDRPILHDPSPVEDADFVLMESTYGDRLHRSPEETRQEVVEIVEQARKARGNIVIPAFAVGRTQHLLYAFARYFDDWNYGLSGNAYHRDRYAQCLCGQLCCGQLERHQPGKRFGCDPDLRLYRQRFSRGGLTGQQCDQWPGLDCPGERSGRFE